MGKKITTLDENSQGLAASENQEPIAPACGQEIPEHHRTVHFSLDKAWCEESAIELEADLQELNSLFSAVGTGIKVEGNILSLDINLEKFHMVTTRKAGRKSKSLSGKQFEEIMAYRETHTAMETAEWLGLTKQTYYRRMKELKEESAQESGRKKDEED